MHSDHHKETGRAVRIGSKMVRTDGSDLGYCLLTEISATCARLKLHATDPLPESFILLLSHNGQLCRHCSVEWQSGNEVGVRFVANRAEQTHQRPSASTIDRPEEAEL